MAIRVTTCTTLTAAKATSPYPSRAPLSFDSHEEGDQAKTQVGEESYGIPRRLPLAQRSAMAGRVTSLEGRLFDHDGHVRRGLDAELVDGLLTQINELRRDLGWLSLDRHHQPIWPEHIAS